MPHLKLLGDAQWQCRRINAQNHEADAFEPIKDGMSLIGINVQDGVCVANRGLLRMPRIVVVHHFD
jgi:hypothetical protein